MDEIELKHSRLRLAKILKGHSFVFSITPQSVSRLTNKGFQIGGEMGARFTLNEGLIIRNRGQRNAGPEFTVSELMKLESELKEEFKSIWKMN